jgi:predicted amidohydrolase
MPCTVAALELPHRHGAVAAQLALADAELAALSGGGVQLALLPEAILTGYLTPRFSFDLRRLAEPRGGPTELALQALARKHRLALAAPLLERDGDRFYNSFLVHSREGEVLAHYRKRHPWFPERWHSAGTAPPPLFEVEGVCFTLAICFDVHFLPEDGAPQLEAADALLFPSDWCEESFQHPDQRDDLLPALALAHRLTVVNANWGVGVPRLPGQGGSRIVGPDGCEQARTAPGGPPRLVVTLAGHKPARGSEIGA